jgi:uncharacterized membrane protein
MPARRFFSILCFLISSLLSAIAQVPSSDVSSQVFDLQPESATSMEARYVFVKFDFPGAADFTEPKAITNNFDIAGRFLGPDGRSHCFVISAIRTRSFDFPGAAQSDCSGINIFGTITGGFSSDPNPFPAFEHGLLLRNGKFSSVNVRGADKTRLGGDNAQGFAVGEYTIGSVRHAFRFNFVTRTITKLRDFPASNVFTTAATAINSHGVIVGIFENPHQHGFVLKNGVYRSINVPGAQETLALGINNNPGTIVGFFQTASDPHAHGFVMRPGSRFQRVDVPGSTATVVWSINDAGVLVGRYEDSVGRSHGFIAFRLK